MKIYLLERDNPTGAIWDAAHGFTVQAMSPNRARVLAGEACGDEGKEVWSSPTLVKCTLVGYAPRKCGPAKVLLRDYHAA